MKYWCIIFSKIDILMLYATKWGTLLPPPCSQNISTQGLVMIPNIFKWLGWIIFFKCACQDGLLPGWLLVSVYCDWCPRGSRHHCELWSPSVGHTMGFVTRRDGSYKALVTGNGNTTTAQRAGKNGKSISFHEAPFSRIVFIFIPYFGQSSPSQPGNKCTLPDPFNNLK